MEMSTRNRQLRVGAAVNELFDIRQTLQIAKAIPDANRPAFMVHALVYLNLVRGELFTSNPDNQLSRPPVFSADHCRVISVT